MTGNWDMERRGFIFSWERVRRWRINWRLVYMIAVSTVAHVTVFYLFQVSYPPVERWTPRSQQIMLLSTRDPISSQVLHELEDRTFHLRGAGTGEIAAYSQASLTPKFRPSFSGHTAALRPVPPPEREERLVTLFEPGGAVLPPLPPRSGEATGDGPGLAQVSLRVVLDGGEVLEGAEAEQVPGWETAVTEAPGTWRRLRVRIGIGEDGRVVHLLEDAEQEDRGSAVVLNALRRSVRFPESGLAVRWGWLELRRGDLSAD